MAVDHLGLKCQSDVGQSLPGPKSPRIRPPAMVSKLLVWHHPGNERLRIFGIVDAASFVSKCQETKPVILNEVGDPIVLRGRLKPLTFQNPIFMGIEGGTPLRPSFRCPARRCILLGPPPGHFLLCGRGCFR
ncbi:UNVERIFIED_CONTAM: hypothetical protein Sindi_2638000 [Sesamum indicum]